MLLRVVFFIPVILGYILEIYPEINTIAASTGDKYNTNEKMPIQLIPANCILFRL